MIKTGILITNTGTPDAPTTSAVRRYLRQFLSDKRIVKIPRIIWLPILYLLILPFRSGRSAKLYQAIWTEQGSPMRVLMQNLANKLNQHFNVAVGMNYGNPSIASALATLQSEKIDKLIILPLFPQYSNTTTASSFDQISATLHTWPALPDLVLIKDYHTHPAYIAALSQSVKDFWQAKGDPAHLLISFHGIPKRFVEAGDPYGDQCAATAKLLAEHLGLTASQWTLCFQSQFGYDKWLQPSTQALLLELPKRGETRLDVICPGFSMDCLETLEEIQEQGAHDFIAAGGKSLRMIPALNDSDLHVKMLADILQPML